MHPLASFAEEDATPLTFPSVTFQDMRRMNQSEVIDVVGAQTLLMRDGSIIELSGIDVPDRYGDEISPLAVTARDILNDLMSNKKVTVYQTKDKDSGRSNRMGHSLAHVERIDNGAWAQGTLLALGLARVKTQPSNAHMATEMLEIEAKARLEGIGIWGDDRYAVLSSDNAEAGLQSFAIVEGEIESVALKKNRIYINFGRDWKKDFTVSIAPQDKRAFSKAKLDPLGWGGQVIRARGAIREYNGPYMEISHPAAIEFIEE